MRKASLVLALSALVLLSCKGKDEAPSTDPLDLIPAELHGVYGRTAEDSPGLTVSATGLEFGEMTMIIHEGKMEGDTVRVERATLQWQKLEPKTCTGTISRQKDRLLMKLYEVGGAQEECEVLLDAQWHLWKPLTELPAQLQGRFDVLTIGPKQLKVEIGWFSAKMTTDQIFELPGSNDERVELLVHEGLVHPGEIDGEQRKPDGEPEAKPCTGTIKLEDGWLSSDFWAPKRLEPKPDDPDPTAQERYREHSRICADWNGRAQKFEVDLARAPKAPIKKGDLSLSVTADKVTLESPALRCEQELWRTESVAARPGVFGGERLTLGKAEPTGLSDACRLNIRIWCERDAGHDTSALDAATPPDEWVAMCMQEREHELCPRSITIQAVSDVRYKFVVEPRTFNEIACVDTTGDFTLQN